MIRCIFGWTVAIGLAIAAQGQVIDVDSQNFDTIVDGDAHVMLEFYAPWCGHCKKLAPEYETLGKMFADDKEVIIAKVNAEADSDLARKFEVKGYPTLKWFPKGKTEPSDAEVVQAKRTAKDLAEYIGDKTGTKKKLPSQPPSAVQALTKETLDAVALNPSKDVLVEFYAPWCGHCKALAPVYEKVANAFAGEDNVVVAKMDCTAEKDSCGQYGVTGFPTLKFFPKGESEVEPYSGARDLNSIVKFINEKAGTSREPDGTLAGTAGRVASLDDVLQSFGELGLEELSVRLEEAAGNVAEDEVISAGHYTRAAKKIIEKGTGYVDTELNRLTGLLEGTQNLSPQKKTLFMTRTNILGAFKEAGIGGDLETLNEQQVHEDVSRVGEM